MEASVGVLLDEVRRLGIEIALVDGVLSVRPADRLPADLRERLRAHKPDILAALLNRPATCAASCYEIEPGRWIHHPWDGCKTVALPGGVRAVSQSECRHCDGLGVCACPACNLRRTPDAVPCYACHPLERQAWLAATRPEECCWHCGGSGKCACISCGESAACRVCGGSGKDQVRIKEAQQ